MELAREPVQQVAAVADDDRLVAGQDRIPCLGRHRRHVAVGAERRQNRGGFERQRCRGESFRESTGALSPGGQPEIVVLDIEQQTLHGPLESLSQRLFRLPAPVGPSSVVVERKSQGQHQAVVRGEGEAEAVLDGFQLELGETRVEADEAGAESCTQCFRRVRPALFHRAIIARSVSLRQASFP